MQDERQLPKPFFCDHPLYSPDLVLSNFHLFAELKKWFGVQRFKLMSKTTFKLISRLLAATFYEEVTGKVVVRYDKCLNRFDDYRRKVTINVHNF